MYQVAVTRDFIAQHYLIGGDWGAENQKHSHHFRVEVTLEGAALDQHNYLVDIVDIEANLDRLIASYRDQTFNELPEFQGKNPSIEHLASCLCRGMHERIQAPNVTRLSVKIWETPTAWAAFHIDR